MKKKLKKIKQNIKKNNKRDIKIKLTKNKLKSLTQIESVEDLYYISSLISLNELSKYINHLKDNLKKVNIKKIDESIVRLIKKYKEPLKFITDLNEELIKKLKEDHDKIYSQISEKRKKGIDMLIAELEIMSIPFKIKIFESTLDKKDYYKVKGRIDKLKKILEIKKD